MKFYEADITEMHRGYFRYEVCDWNNKLYISDRHLPFLRLYTLVYCNEDLKPYMDWKFPNDILREPEEVPVSCYMMEYDRLEKIGIRVNKFSELRSKYRFVICDEDFFGPDNLTYLSYHILQEGKTILESVTYTDEIGNDAKLLVEKKVMEKLDTILTLPLARNLPEPLRSVVYDQTATDSGMLFIENDDEFAENWDEKKLSDLSSQIDLYGLNTYIDMPKDPKDAFQIEKGEPVITAYCGLATKFNFI